jgi:hypothetical protein
MPKKGKFTKRKGSRQKGRKAKSGKPSPKSQSPLQTIKVHPHLAHAILSLKKFAPDELENIKSLSSVPVAEGGQPTACWISDSGGQQHCVNLSPDVCTRNGGISVPTRCPNS